MTAQPADNSDSGSGSGTGGDSSGPTPGETEEPSEGLVELRFRIGSNGRLRYAAPDGPRLVQFR